MRLRGLLRSALLFAALPAGSAAAQVIKLGGSVESERPTPLPSGGIYGVEPGVLPGAGAPGPVGAVPDQHVVRKGDTLWSVCELYFSDPWRWPKLWAENAQITNPHWIFPGDVLRLREPGRAAPSPDGPAGPHISSTRQGSLSSQAVVLREIGFIEAGALAESGRISGSKEEKIMLASGDQAYVGFPKEKPLRAGERYTVFVADTEHPVKAPENGKVIGYLVRVYGDLVVDQVTDRNMARGNLVEVVGPVERGFGVSAQVQQWKRIQPRPSGVTLEARIAASFSPTNLLAAESFVVLSRGSRDGLAVGNRSFVVRRGDGYRPVMADWHAQDDRFPKEVVGELWIVDVRESAAVAWVAHSTKELHVGEVTELRKGH